MDSRFELDVTFTIYGKTFRNKCSLNWTPPDGYNGCDRRIQEMFEKWHDEAKLNIDEQCGRPRVGSLRQRYDDLVCLWSLVDTDAKRKAESMASKMRKGET